MDGLNTKVFAIHEENWHDQFKIDNKFLLSSLKSFVWIMHLLPSRIQNVVLSRFGFWVVVMLKDMIWDSTDWSKSALFHRTKENWCQVRYLYTTGTTYCPFEASKATVWCDCNQMVIMFFYLFRRKKRWNKMGRWLSVYGESSLYSLHAYYSTARPFQSV